MRPLLLYVTLYLKHFLPTNNYALQEVHGYPNWKGMILFSNQVKVVRGKGLWKLMANTIPLEELPQPNDFKSLELTTTTELDEMIKEEVSHSLATISNWYNNIARYLKISEAPNNLSPNVR